MSTTKRIRAHANKGGKRVAVCEANIPLIECQYKKDLNYWADEFTKVNMRCLTGDMMMIPILSLK
jgi:hypothetical protein